MSDALPACVLLLVNGCSDGAGSDRPGSGAAGTASVAGAAGSASVAGNGGQPGAGGTALGSGGASAGTGGGGASTGGVSSAGSAGSAGVAGSAGSGGTGSALCLDRTGGALVDFQIGPDTLRLWLTEEDFISEAESQLQGAAPRIPSLSLVDGRDCDTQWSWHVDPATPEFVDESYDICSYRPSDVEDDKSYWLSAVTFCPNEAVVTGVQRR